MKMCDVFISYRRSDGAEIAESLCQYLREGGLRVFLDTSGESGIEIGSTFPAQLKQAIEMAAHYVLIASPDAVKERADEKDWVFEEINTAYDLFNNNNNKCKASDRTFSILRTDKNVVLPEMLEDSKLQCVNIYETEEQRLDAFKQIFELATKANRKNLWYAAHRWLERATSKRGRFAALNISETIMPDVQRKEHHSELPINIFTEGDTAIPLLEALEKTDSNIMLVGEGGAGKTTALTHIMKKAYETEYTANSQIPIFIELSYAPDTFGELYNSHRPSFIRRSIYRQLCQGRLDEVNKTELDYIDRIFSKIPEEMINPITSLLSDDSGDVVPEYLLLLDGLNEVSTTEIEGLGKSAMQMVLEEIRYLIADCPNVQLIITSRSQTIDLENTQCYNLCGVNDDAIIRYLEEAGVKEKADKVTSNNQLKEVLKNPLFLTLYASGDVADDVLSAGEILHSFFNIRQQKLNADIEYNLGRESGYNPNRFTVEIKNFILRFLIPEIAWTMEKENIYNLYADELEDIITAFLDKKGESEILGRFAKQIFICNEKNVSKIAEELVKKYSDTESLTSAILDCCVNALGIMQADGPAYSFIHQHIRDYFAAQKNINDLRLAAYLAYERGKTDEALNALAEFNKEPVNITVRRFIGEVLGEHRNKPCLQNGVWYSSLPKEKCDRNLISRALNAYRNKFNGECGYGIYSLITILKEIRQDLSGEDLSYLDMKYCHLNGTVLGRPYLSASFKGSLVNDYTFMYPENSGTCERMAISSNGLLLATYSKGEVYLWSLETFSLIKKLDICPHEAFIKNLLCLDFIESGKTLAVTINYVNYDKAFQDLIKLEMPQEVTRKEYRETLDNIIEKNNLMKTKTIRISSDTFEITEFPEFNNDIAFSQAPDVYKASEPQTFRIPEEVDFSECKSLADLKSEKSGEGTYSEYISPDGKFSLCQFSEGLALYDLQTESLINRFQNYNWYFGEINVFFINLGILVISGNGTIVLFDYSLKILQKKELSLSVDIVTLSKQHLALCDSLCDKITVLNTDSFDISGTIDNNRPNLQSVYFCQDKNTAFFNTNEDKGFVYDLNKKQVIDFVEGAYDCLGFDYSKKLLYLMKGITSYYHNHEIPHTFSGFSKKSPTELKSVIGCDYLRQKEQPVYHKTKKLNQHTFNIISHDYSNGLWLIAEENLYPLTEKRILCCNENKETLATIDCSTGYYQTKAIFTSNNEKIVLLDPMGNCLYYIDTKDLILKKKFSTNELQSITITDFLTFINCGLCKAPDDNSVSVVNENKIYFYNIETEKCYNQIQHTGGLYIVDLDLTTLHSRSELSEEAKQKLRQYGAKL